MTSTANRRDSRRAGVEFVRRGGKEPWGGRISTFLHPDGNYYQLIETPESRSAGA